MIRNTYVYIYVYMYIYIYVYTYIYSYIYMRIHTCIDITYICIRCIYICIYMNICVCDQASDAQGSPSPPWGPFKTFYLTSPITSFDSNASTMPTFKSLVRDTPQITYHRSTEKSLNCI